MLFTLQSATLAARERTGDKSIGTQIKQGRLQIIRVTFPAEKRGLSIVEPVSDWLPIADAIKQLDAMQ